MKAIKYIFYSAFFLIILGTLLLFAAPKLPYVGALSIKIVQSGSMEPTINTGGIVVIRSVESYGVGDVVTFTSEDAKIPTTHRIIAIETVNGVEQFVTKGDANEDPDSTLVFPSSIIGKVVFDVPYIGFIFDFVRTPKGFMLLVIPPALLILFDEIEKIAREVRRVRKEKKDDGDTKPPSGMGGGGVPQESLLLYERKASPRFMDIRPLRIPSVIPPSVASQSGDSVVGYKTTSMGVVALLCITVFGMSSVGSTVSYFNDSESLLGNLLRAISLDVSASQDASALTFDENGALVDEDGVVLLLLEKEKGSVDVLYDVHVEKTSGIDALCSALDIAIVDPFIYDGSLLALSVSDVDLVNAVALEVILDSGAYAPLDACGVDVVFVAHASDGSGGYSDEERIPLLFTAPELLPGAPLEAILESVEGDGTEDIPFIDETEGSEEPEIEAEAEDNNNGHGNDEDHNDDSNPGNSNDNNDMINDETSLIENQEEKEKEKEEIKELSDQERSERTVLIRTVTLEEIQAAKVVETEIVD